MKIPFLTKKPTVEQIHQEFDSAETRLLTSIDELLASLNIQTESRLIEKSNLAKDLGFVNSEPVVKDKK